MIGFARDFNLKTITDNAKVSILLTWSTLREYLVSLWNKSISSAKINDSESGTGSPTFVIVQNDRSDIDTEQLL